MIALALAALAGLGIVAWGVTLVFGAGAVGFFGLIAVAWLIGQAGPGILVGVLAFAVLWAIMRLLPKGGY